MVLYLDTRKVIHPEAVRLFISSTERHHALTMGVCDLTPHEVVDSVKKGDLRMYERMVEWAFDELVFTKYVDGTIEPINGSAKVKKLIYVGTGLNSRERIIASADRRIVSETWREWFREAVTHSVDRVIHKKTIEELARDSQGSKWTEVDSLYKKRCEYEQSVLRKHGLEYAGEEEWDVKYEAVEKEFRADEGFITIGIRIKELEGILDPKQYTKIKNRLYPQLIEERAEKLALNTMLPATQFNFFYALACVENKTGNYEEYYKKLVEAHDGLRLK